MRRRIRTLQAVLRTSPIRGEPEFARIIDEYEEVVRVNPLLPQARRWLLQVLHSTRGLDTTLVVFLRAKGIPIGGQSLGAYLYTLRDHTVPGVGNLTGPERANYQHRIVRRRNTYMHNAGAAPANVFEIQALVNEMNACLVRVLAL